MTTNLGPGSWEEADAMVRDRCGPDHKVIGQLSFHRREDDGQVTGDFLGSLSLRLVQKLCLPLWNFYLDDVHSSESIDALKLGKQLTYYLNASQSDIEKAIVNHIQDNNNHDLIGETKVLHVPIGVDQQEIVFSPPFFIT